MNSNRLDIADALLGSICALAMLAYWSIAVLILNTVYHRDIVPGWIALFQTRNTPLVLLFAGLLFHLVFLLLAKTGPKSFGDWLRQYGPQWLRYCYLSVIVIGTLAAYTPIKEAMLLVERNSIDVILMRMMLHVGFGDYPWHRLQPLLGHPLVTVALDRFYTAGAGTVVWLTSCGILMQTRRRRLAEQYVLAYVAITALLGSLLAYMLASAGPCFYGRMGLTPDPYAPLMSYLRSVDSTYGLASIALQDELWDAFVTHGAILGGGISAMPSMHMAYIALASLAAWQYARVFGVAVWTVTLIVYIGGIHLAWHYAADGLVSLVLVLFIWRVSGWIVASIVARSAGDQIRPASAGEAP